MANDRRTLGKSDWHFPADLVAILGAPLTSLLFVEPLTNLLDRAKQKGHETLFCLGILLALSGLILLLLLALLRTPLFPRIRWLSFARNCSTSFSGNIRYLAYAMLLASLAVLLALWFITR